MNSTVDDRIEIHQGDITKLDVDAIVNAANDNLGPGGGVCRAIHKAAGPKLAEACAAIGGCPTGEARITPGFDLPARHVIHGVGPVWAGGDKNEDGLLASCYRHCLALAAENDCRTLAFPALSTGIYGFPLVRATNIAVNTVREVLEQAGLPERVIFTVFGPDAEQAYRDVLGR